LNASVVRNAGDLAAHEDELVRRARDRDSTAFAGLVLIHGDRLHRLLVRALGNEDEAQEVAQEVLLRAWRGLPSFEGTAKFSTWLHRIAVNETNRRLERNGRAQFVSLDDAADLAAPADAEPPAIAEAAELRKHVARCVTELPEHYQAVIRMVDIEQHSNDQAAGMLDIGVRNLKSRLHRAPMMVRRCVEIVVGRRTRGEHPLHASESIAVIAGRTYHAK